MNGRIRFRAILPLAQCGLAGLFGGFGLWQRSTILSRSLLEGQTGWSSTARFHVWPWPYKFAVIANIPALVAGSFLAWPIGSLFPRLPEALQMAPSLLLVWILWRWVGSKLDLRWRVAEIVPWGALVIFCLVCLAGALVPIGYVGYLPFGFLVWMITTIAVARCNRYAGLPVPSPAPDSRSTSG
jgi:hypothetical protein